MGFQVEMIGANKRVMVTEKMEANSPKEAAFECMENLTWRRRKALMDCKVTYLDGSQRVWNY